MALVNVLPQAYVSLAAHVLCSRAHHLEQIGLQLGGSLRSGWGARTAPLAPIRRRKEAGVGGFGAGNGGGAAVTTERCGEGPSWRGFMLAMGGAPVETLFIKVLFFLLRRLSWCFCRRMTLCQHVCNLCRSQMRSSRSTRAAGLDVMLGTRGHDLQELGVFFFSSTPAAVLKSLVHLASFSPLFLLAPFSEPLQLEAQERTK